MQNKDKDEGLKVFPLDMLLGVLLGRASIASCLWSNLHHQVTKHISLLQFTLNPLKTINSTKINEFHHMMSPSSRSHAQLMRLPWIKMKARKQEDMKRRRCGYGV